VNEKNIMRFVSLFILLITLFFVVEFFEIDFLVLGFILFGVPITCVCGMFWYELANNILNYLIQRSRDDY